MASSEAKKAKPLVAAAKETEVYYFGLMFLKVNLSCNVNYIDERQLQSPPEQLEDQLKWKTFLASVDKDLQLYSMLRKDVKRERVVLQPNFKRIVMFGDRKVFIHDHRKVMSFSDVDKANWGSCVSQLNVKTEKAIAEDEDEDKCHMMIPYFRLNATIPPDHPFFSSAVSFKQRMVISNLKENGWTHRLEWCLNKVYERKVAFSQCYGDDWMRVGDPLLDDNLHWHPFSGTPDMLVMEFGSIPDAPIVVAKEGILESEEESEEGILECKEGDSGGVGQLYAAMLYTAATEMLRHLLKGENVSEQTVTVKGLLINRRNDCTTCQLEVQLFGAGYPNWSCTTITDGALNAQSLLWTLNKLWELPSKG